MNRALICLTLIIICNNLLAQSIDISNNQGEPDKRIYVLHKTLQDETVYTPWGPTLRSNTYYVDNDHLLNQKDGNIELVQIRTGVLEQRFIARFKEFNTNYFLESENKILLSDIINQEGWITHAECEVFIPDPKPTYFSTDWIVPNDPLSISNQTIFLFNGLVGIESLTDDHITFILQPVLQWGISAAGGGKYWAISNWLVTNKGHFFYDTLIKVNSGDNLQGVIKLISYSDSSYNYNSSFTGHSEGLNVFNLPRLERGYFALEAYNLKSCAEYPADEKIRMFNIKMMTDTVFPPIVWHIYNQIDNCGQFTNVIDESPDNGEINIHFHKPHSTDGFEDIYIYPNPIMNNVHFSITNPLYNCTIEVYNSHGNLIHVEKNKFLSYEYYLDFQNYSPGIYIIKLYYQEDLISRETNHVFKVIKIRM